MHAAYCAKINKRIIGSITALGAGFPKHRTVNYTVTRWHMRCIITSLSITEATATAEWMTVVRSNRCFQFYEWLTNTLDTKTWVDDFVHWFKASLQEQSYHIQGGPKNGPFLRVDNFATVNGRKACDMSKVLEFCLEKGKYLYLSSVKYSLPGLHKSSHQPTNVELCWQGGGAELSLLPPMSTGGHRCNGL